MVKRKGGKATAKSKKAEEQEGEEDDDEEVRPSESNLAASCRPARPNMCQGRHLTSYRGGSHRNGMAPPAGI